MSANEPTNFDALVESLRQRASGRVSGTIKRLRLNKEPVAYVFPRLGRDADQIAQPLRAAIHGCVSGRLPWPLCVYGPAGVGKTRAALCLMDLAGGLYFTPEGLAESCLDADKGQLNWQGHAVSRQGLWNAIGTTQLLVLDDVGVAQPSDWVFKQVKRLLDAREGQALFAISNLTLQEIGRLYDDRVASRLGSGTVLHLDGEDRRKGTRR